MSPDEALPYANYIMASSTPWWAADMGQYIWDEGAGPTILWGGGFQAGW